MSEQVKLLLSYNIRAGQENAYRRFVMEELLPKAQELGLTPTDAWHTSYGNYPARLLGFVADDLASLRKATSSEEWQAALEKLDVYAVGLSGRVVRYTGGFQW